MKKSKTAALLAASLLIYGGAFSVQAETIGDDETQIGGEGPEYSREFTDDTIIGGGLYVDKGGKITLTNSNVNVDMDSFTTEGGTITATNSQITSGIWANRNYGMGGSVSVTGGSVSGDTLAAQGYESNISISGSKVNVGEIIARKDVYINNGNGSELQQPASGEGTEGSKIYLTGGADVTADRLTIEGNSEVNINGNAVVNVDNADVTSSRLNVGSSETDGSKGTLKVNGTANFRDGSQFNLSSGATVDVDGKVYLYDTSGITIDGSVMTFKSGSELHVNGATNARAETTGVKVTDGGQLTFENGSSTYTTAQTAAAGEAAVVNTVASADADSTIAVNDGAILYVTNATEEGAQYNLKNVIVKNENGQGWASEQTIYGASKTEELVVGDDGVATVKEVSIGKHWAGVAAAAAFDAALQDNGSAAEKFISYVKANHAEWGDNVDSAYDARVTNALNSAAGMTGLAGVGYGTYRFTTAFTDHVANHEAGGLWASYLHDKSSVDGLSVGNLRADYDLTYDGVVVGSDFYDNGRTTIGAAFAYADGDVSTKSGVSTKNDVDYYGGMIYGSVKGGAGMTYRAEIGYNRSSNDLTQWNTGERITGSVDADAFHVGVAAEKEIRTGSSVWTPFLGLQYIDLSIDDYSDSLGFRHEGDSAGLWNMPVGVNYKYEVANGAWTYAPTVTLGYRFAFGDDSVDETLRYGSGAGSFGTEIAEDSFFTRIGFEAKKDNIGFGVHYGYERGSDTEANQWGINCSFFF